MIKRLASVLLICISAIAFAGAGSLTGNVTDQYALPLPGVEVTATHVASAAKHTAITDDRGVFSIKNLDAGEYSATAKMSGFKTAVSPNITVKDGKATKIKLTMAIGRD